MSIKELIIGRAFANSLIFKVSDIKSINIDIEDHRVDMITIPYEHDPLISQDIYHKAIDTNEIFKLIDKLINDPDKKNIGHYMIINEYDPAECVIMTSGRITKEMIDKVAVAGIPVMISPKKVTTTAIDIAKASGTRLIIRAKPDSFISL